MAIGVGLIEQAPELEQIELASSPGERWMLFAELLKPAEQMRIATQIGEGDQVGEIGLKIAEKAPGGDAVALYGLRSQGGCESLNADMKNLREERVRGNTWSRRAADLGLERSISFGACREIFGEDELGRHCVALGSKVAQQAAEGK
jgi:hypothetical protein